MYKPQRVVGRDCEASKSNYWLILFCNLQLSSYTLVRGGKNARPTNYIRFEDINRVLFKLGRSYYAIVMLLEMRALKFSRWLSSHIITSVYSSMCSLQSVLLCSRIDLKEGLIGCDLHGIYQELEIQQGREFHWFHAE